MEKAQGMIIASDGKEISRSCNDFPVLPEHGGISSHDNRKSILMPSVGSLFALPFPFSFTYVRKEGKVLVDLFSFALMPEAKPSILHGEMQQDGDIYIARGTDGHFLPWLHPF